MELDYVAILVATAVQFVVGALWYMGPFGQTWGKIHGFDKVSKEVQQQMIKQMPPYYLGQLIVTALTSVVFAVVLQQAPEWNPFVVAATLWAGFVVPTQFGAVIFGGTEGKWVVTKLAIMAGGSLACLLAAAAVFTLL